MARLKNGLVLAEPLDFSGRDRSANVKLMINISKPQTFGNERNNHGFSLREQEVFTIGLRAIAHSSSRHFIIDADSTS